MGHHPPAVMLVGWLLDLPGSSPTFLTHRLSLLSLRGLSRSREKKPSWGKPRGLCGMHTALRQTLAPFLTPDHHGKLREINSGLRGPEYHSLHCRQFSGKDILFNFFFF